MSFVIETYTTIHVGADPDAPTPYTVVVVEGDGQRRVIRMDGAPEWLRVGLPVTVQERPDGPAITPAGDGSSPQDPSRERSSA